MGKETDSARALNALSHKIIGAAIRVHKTLGPGLIESAYEACLAHELKLLRLSVETQAALPVVYRDARLDCGYRVDLLVEKAVIVEIKTVMELTPRDEAQLQTYLRLARLPLGLLINFNSQVLVRGIKRVVNQPTKS